MGLAGLRAGNGGELRSYLLAIIARILRAVDEKTGRRLVELIVDSAGQKGTGSWCSQDAMALGVPVPTIDAAVSTRGLSAARSQRETATRLFLNGGARALANDERRIFQGVLRGAFELAITATYAQGMEQLRRASVVHEVGQDLAEVARVWRGGCIIRASLLERIQAAYREDPELSSFLFAPDTCRMVVERLPDLRAVVGAAAALGIPAPGLMSALAYLDGLRRERLPLSLIQAQRDYFGGHGFERVDAEGTFHGTWHETTEPTLVP